MKWIIDSSDEYLFLSPSTTTEEIPQTGWRVRKEAGWEDDDTLTVRELDETGDIGGHNKSSVLASRSNSAK